MFALVRWVPVKLLPSLRTCNSYLKIVTVRCYARPPTQSTKVQRNVAYRNPYSHMVLYKAKENPGFTGVNKPLVVLFQWLYAKPPEVQKCTTLYQDIGLDVLAVRGKISHFLWLPEGVKLADELFGYLKENRPQNEKILVHASSIGAFNYTIALMDSAVTVPEDSRNFRDRVVGQLFDSVVIGTYEDMSHGLAEILSNNESFRRMVLQTVNVYYHITHKTTKHTFNRLVQHLREQPIHIPTLFIYSQYDPVCDTAALEAMISEWKSLSPEFEIDSLSWPKSAHVAHLCDHREEYLAAWRGLMEKLQLL